MQNYDWNKGWANPRGKGIQHQFETGKGGQVVVDKTTGLMWQQSGSPKSMVYDDAKKYIAQLNREKFAGYSDWRLPTLEEAMSLMEPQKKNADLYIDPVFDNTQRWIWTAGLSIAPRRRGSPISTSVFATPTSSPAAAMFEAFVLDNLDNLVI